MLPPKTNATGIRFTKPRSIVPFGCKFCSHAAPPKPEQPNAVRNCVPVATQRRKLMPAIIIPVLWVGGAAVLLGGGWYVIGHMVH